VTGRLRRAWSGLPRWARWLLAVYLIVFADGTAAHVRDLAGRGIHAYSWAPQLWIRVFFVALVILDPLVFLLVAFVRREGIWLAAGVMVADATANWIANLRTQAQLGGLTLIIVVCVFVLVTALPLLRAINSPSGRPPSPGTAALQSRHR
jgi:hypothetical protein